MHRCQRGAAQRGPDSAAPYRAARRRRAGSARCAVPWRPLPAAAELRLGVGGCRAGSRSVRRGLRGAEPPGCGRCVLRGRFLLISSCRARRALLTAPSPPPRQLALFIYASHKSRVGANVPPPASPARSREPAALGFPGQTFAGCEVPSLIYERRTLQGTFGSV